MFAKMITFLCVSTNKDPPIEVSVTTNAGTGERAVNENSNPSVLHMCNYSGMCEPLTVLHKYVGMCDNLSYHSEGGTLAPPLRSMMFCF